MAIPAKVKWKVITADMGHSGHDRSAIPGEEIRAEHLEGE